MMRLFLKHVIGGVSGKRESAWFVFLLFMGWTGWLTWVEFAHGREMEQAASMWMVLAPFVIGWIAGAHGLEWRSRQSPTARQTGAAQDAAGFEGFDPLPDEPARPQR